MITAAIIIRNFEPLLFDDLGIFSDIPELAAVKVLNGQRGTANL
jgi:hypothetical protein